MKNGETFKIVLLVKFRGCNEWVQSARIKKTNRQLSDLRSDLSNLKKLEHLYFPLPDGTTVYVHPEDISYVNVKIILPFTQQLKKLFTLHA